MTIETVDTTDTMLEQLEAQIVRLPTQAQLRLVSKITQRLSSATPVEHPTVVLPASPARNQQDVEAMLAELDAIAELWEGTFDSSEEIRQMRHERDEHLWTSKL